MQVMHAPTTAGSSYKGQLAYDLGTLWYKVLRPRDTVYTVLLPGDTRTVLKCTVPFVTALDCICTMNLTMSEILCTASDYIAFLYCLMQWSECVGGHKSLAAPPPIL